MTIRRKRWAVAAETLEEAQSVTQRMAPGYPYATARLDQAYGLMHAQKGEAGPLRERLEAALVRFQGLGARTEAAQVERLLRSLHLPGCDVGPAVTPSSVADG